MRFICLGYEGGYFRGVDCSWFEGVAIVYLIIGMIGYWLGMVRYQLVLIILRWVNLVSCLVVYDSTG